MDKVLWSRDFACNDTSRFGYPCVSSLCDLTQQDSDEELKYYTKHLLCSASICWLQVYMARGADIY